MANSNHNIIKEGISESSKFEAGENLSPQQKELAEIGFTTGTKLDLDYNNAISSAPLWAKAGEFEGIEPIKLYEEYFRDKYPESADYTMSLSDLDAVSVLNRLVREFNADLERIKREKDEKAVKDFVANAQELLIKKRRST